MAGTEMKVVKMDPTIQCRFLVSVFQAAGEEDGKPLEVFS